MSDRVVAYVPQPAGRDRLGVASGSDGRDRLAASLPENVELVDAPREDVRFAVPAYGVEIDLEALPALEVVQLLSAGAEWMIDRVPEGVTLCNARGARDRAMAEWIVAALLADLKRVRPFAEAQAARRWKRLDIHDLSDLKVAVLGHGASGRELERLLAPFGTPVRGIARRARPDEGVVALEDAGEVLAWCDALVNLLPLTPETKRVVDAKFLSSLPDDALYVNLGRGPTTDTYALIEELRRGRLRAVLDVVDPEPLPPEHPLWEAPGLMLSPHVAGDTPGSDRAAWRLVAEQLARFARGERLVNVVSSSAGY
ncbi:MAG TPA: NAD(P)-dependent oxidoreductase [Baekduia sp.]|uniref:NAD(P)-dependent oxidoreductase n=1 Tax=Baekduia sp. TaxID=2600305 RepID=UPI002D790498|nr:NAD(P)-dependent oxidoreductase [Baekduia sp.]HET6510378.1 NAD(P)-dependent oxidoreductase [Baekduia sp.]